MKTKELTPRQVDEIKNLNRRIEHRPISERLDFLNSFLKLRMTEDQFLKAIAP